MKRKNGFTLIELIAVLVILAILALIVTPLVMNIIRKARISADKRSIDAYGRSVELAIATYLLDNGDFPTDISQLSIEYSGDRVECETTQLNSDSSVYLTGCTVGGRNVDYTYGTDKTPSTPTYTAYSVGDSVTYNNVDYYVIKDSGTNESIVTLLKAEPLTVDEVNLYGVGHINNYSTYVSQGTAFDVKGDGSIGGMAYYSSSSCAYTNESIEDGCISDYESSDIKYVVDSWASANGLSDARLVTYDEIYNNSEEKLSCAYSCFNSLVVKYDWLYSSEYAYWGMTPSSAAKVYYVHGSGRLQDVQIYWNDIAIRPVITLKKSALEN